jgi:hypothetical protein
MKVLHNKRESTPVTVSNTILKHCNLQSICDSDKRRGLVYVVTMYSKHVYFLHQNDRV